MLILVGLTAGPNWLSFLETLKKFENYNFIILFGIKELNKLWKKTIKTSTNCHVSWDTLYNQDNI